MFLLLKIFFYLILFAIIAICLKDLTFYLRYKKYYAKQGIKLHYAPIFGASFALFDDEESKDAYGGIRRLLAGKYKNEKLIIFNEYNDSKNHIVINDVEMLKLFFIKENEHIIRDEFMKTPFYASFFSEMGEKALKERSIFSEFFSSENLARITPAIQKIISRHMEELKQKLWGDQKKNFEFKEFDFNKFTPDLFSEMANEILFGCDNSPRINGLTIPQAIEEVEDLTFDIAKSTLNAMTLGTIHNTFKLHPLSSKVFEMGNQVNEEIRKMIKKREKQNVEDLGQNALDLMIRHNKTCSEKDRLSIKRQIGTVNLLESAGNDTMKTSMQNFIKFFSMNKKVGKKISEEIIPENFKSEEDWDSYKNFHNSDYLNHLYEELMRQYGSAALIFPKLIVKNFKLGKYKLRAGDKILIFPLSFHFNDKYFENPNKFDEERFSKENSRKIKKNSYMPFYAGKRGCVGKYVAGLILRMVTLNLFKRFELDWDGKEPEFVLGMNFTVKESGVLFRPREINW